MTEPCIGADTNIKNPKVNPSHEDDADDNNLMSTWSGISQGFEVPKYGWRIALSHKFNGKRSPWVSPKISQMPALVGLAFRYLRFHHRLKQISRRPCMDFFDQQPLRQIYGVPAGGIGGGCFNRGWKGEFCRWQLRPGIYEFETTVANQFLVCIRRSGQTVYQKVLSPFAGPQKGLKGWQWGFPASKAFYHALYPRAWTVYEIPHLGITLTCRQISPVMPHEYKDSSIPAVVFSWNIENTSYHNFDVSIALVMENGIGTKKARSHAGNYNEEFVTDKTCSGITMYNFAYEKMPYTMTIGAHEAADNKVTRCLAFNPASDGLDIWNDLAQDGEFQNSGGKSRVTSPGQALGCGVAIKATVNARSSKNNCDFVLTWDMPMVYFGSKEVSHCRRYTRFFGSDGKAGEKMALYALDNYPIWEQKINAWQNEILSNPDLPAWYKSAIFNELYYITDGGTIWLESAKHKEQGNSSNNHTDEGDSSAEENLRRSELIQEYGRFAYLEGQEYRMFNTYDVHFYASIALAHLWPKLELSLQYDIAASILQTDETSFHFLMDGDRGLVKSPGVVPHDVGDPEDEPWKRVNAYFVHDTASWRDLNPKFVLQVFRDYHITKDKKFLEDMWPVCLTVMAMAMQHDKDGDGLIENGGTADQTFDGWSVKGPSAYCGGLWIAALRCMFEAGKILDRRHEGEKYEEMLAMATKAYQTKLWNGEYFNYDSNPRSSHSDSIMADQCAGQWYLLASDIADVLPDEQVVSSLKKVFNFNVLTFANGKRGAVNGMRPNGKIDQSSVQSHEVWCGVTYAVAATMIHKGMLKEAFITAKGMYKSCWEELGMAFQTPEAILKHNHYRSLAYMRPLSIWGMQYALDKRVKKPLTDEIHTTDKPNS